MAVWQFGVGNLARRAAAAPVAVTPAVADTVLGLANLADDYPDTLGALQWRADGAYALDFDLNLLVTASSRVDAPTGWADLLLALAGTPGLPANPPDWGNYGGRTPALRIYRPSVQYVDVMPGETVELAVGIHWPAAAAGATGVRVRVVDLWSGLGWEGGSANDWQIDGVALEQLDADAWLDGTITITADPARPERSTYQVIVEPIAAAYDATTYVYASADGAAGSPALYAAVNLCAIVGSNLPLDATVSLDQQPSGTSITLAPATPSFYGVGASPILAQTWRLSIQMPATWHPAPRLGEVWIGTLRSFGRAPDLPMERSEGDASQVRVEGAGGRLEVLSDGGRAVSAMRLKWMGPEAEYLVFREELTKLTRWGQEPMLLIPSAAFEGAGVLYHGRLGRQISYSRITAAEAPEAWRSWVFEFVESPFAAP